MHVFFVFFLVHLYCFLCKDCVLCMVVTTSWLLRDLVTLHCERGVGVGGRVCVCMGGVVHGGRHGRGGTLQGHFRGKHCGGDTLEPHQTRTTCASSFTARGDTMRGGEPRRGVAVNLIYSTTCLQRGSQMRRPAVSHRYRMKAPLCSGRV